MIKLKIILQYKYTILTLSIFSLIISYFITNYYNFNSKYDIDDSNITGYINSITIDGDKLNIEIIGKEKLIGIYYFKTLEERKEFINKYNLGDYINIIGELKVPNNNTVFNLFNYKKYLYYNKIYYLIDIESIELYKKNNNILFYIKNFILNRINNIDKSNAYIYTFVLGNMSYIDSDVNYSFQINGISHLFSVSGTNVSFIAIIILKLLDNFKYKYTIVFIFLFLYLFLANFADALFRSTIFFILLSLNKIFKLNISTINNLLLSLIICIIFDPFIIYSVGFQFSFIISMYLILFNKLISKYKSKIGTLLIVAIISFLSSIPIVVSNFFQLNLLSIILNIIYVPYVSLILFPFSIITFIFPVFDYIMYILIKILEISSLFFSKINIFILIFSDINVYAMIIYYTFITVSLYGLYKSKLKYCIPLIVILIIHYNINYFHIYPSITFIDVGQGDSILIRLPHSKGNILIDTGGTISIEKEEWAKRNKKYSLGTDTIVSYLKSEGIKRLDYLIFTHGDYDHIGESINLINNFKVKNVIFNVGNYNNLELELIKVLNVKNIPYYQNIEILNIGKDNLYFLNTGIYDNENDNSNVIYFKLNNYKFLFMGDAGINREKDILDKHNLTDIDFLKVGHHGSNTSSSKHFIDKINPKNCLILVGKNNRYGHPDQSVLDTLKNCNIYRTDINGSIEIKLKNNNYSIKIISP